MEIKYSIVVDADISDNFDPIYLLDQFARAIEAFRLNGELTPDDDDTTINHVTLYLDDA